MDSLTQAALGAVVGERLLGSRLGKSALAWGALVGTLPDLDILAYPWLDTIAELYWHRGFSHSLVGVLVGTPIVAWILWRWWNRRSRIGAGENPRIPFTLVALFVFLNFASHILIDCFTGYGTQLLEPFSDQRFGLNIFFIIDPLFTLPLLVWIAAALMRKAQPGVAARPWAFGCAVAVIGYVAFSFSAQSIASNRFERELADRGIEPLRGQVSAAPFTTLIWRGLYETDDAFWISYWAVTDADERLSFAKVPRQTTFLDPYRGDRAIDCALWFSEEYLLVEPSADGASFETTDLRFTEFWPDDTNGMPRTFFSWRIAPETADLPAIFEPIRSTNRDLAGLFEKLRERLSGNQTALLPAETK